MKIQLPGSRNACKEALVCYVKIAINKWHNLGAEVVIPKWDPRKHKAHSMEVDIIIDFDKQDHLPLLYGSRTCLQEPLFKMADDILNNFAEHVNNTDTFRDEVYTRIDLLSEYNSTEKPLRYTLAHHTPGTRPMYHHT
jgi:hypothetical protein